MHDFKLSPRSPLNGYKQTFGDTSLSEVTDYGLISLAIPVGKTEIFSTKIQSEYLCAVPGPGQLAVSERYDIKLLWMQSHQYFLMGKYSEQLSVKIVKQRLSDIACISNQSDSWVMLYLQGQGSTNALERICPLDLHPQSFPTGSVSRTSMEHMPTVIIKKRENQFLLLGLRSSAHSFLHAIKTSIENTC